MKPKAIPADKGRTSCTTETYACFDPASKDALVPIEEGRVGRWPVWMAVR